MKYTCSWMALLLLTGLCVVPAWADRASAEPHEKEGKRCFEAGDTTGAISAYSRAIEEDPEWALVWGMRAWAKLISNRNEGMLQDFDQAVTLQPEETKWRRSRLQAYLGLDRVTEAIEEGETLMKLEPEHPASSLLLGLALIQSGEVDPGFDMMTKALEASGNAPSFLMRSNGFRAKADWSGMIKEAELAKAAGLETPGIDFDRVQGYTELGEYQKASAAILDIKNQTGTIAYISRAYLASTPAAVAFYNPAKAVADAQTAAGTLNDSRILEVLARALLLTGQANASLDLLSTKGIRTNGQIMFWLGASYWKVGQFPEARAALKDARRLNPDLLTWTA